MNYLKFRMNSRESAYRVKDAIIERANNLGFVSLNDVRAICCGSLAALTEEGDNIGWKWSDLKGNNIKVVMAKMGADEKLPWLYICEPEFKVKTLYVDREETEYVDKEETEIKDSGDYILINELFGYLMDLYENRRKCYVTKTIKKKKTEIKAGFHGWTENRIVKEDGTVVDQLLAICKFEDGHVERINFDHIRFVNDWED